jgi:DNA-binding NarL/FixJ family response regulator
MSAVVAPIEEHAAGFSGSISEQPAKGHSAVRVFAVDSRPLVRSGLARLIGCTMACQAEALADLDQAAAALRLVEPAPRALVLGVRTGENPMALVGEARRLGAPVVCVVDCDDAALIGSVLAAGADRCLVLDLVDGETLRAAVAAAAAGLKVIPPELHGSCSHSGHRDPVITVRCLEVLRLLAEGLHDHEIAERLGISTSSVRKHIFSAERRLGARTRTQAVAMAVRWGFL